MTMVTMMTIRTMITMTTLIIDWAFMCLIQLVSVVLWAVTSRAIPTVTRAFLADMTNFIFKINVIITLTASLNSVVFSVYFDIFICLNTGDQFIDRSMGLLYASINFWLVCGFFENGLIWVEERIRLLYDISPAYMRRIILNLFIHLEKRGTYYDDYDYGNSEGSNIHLIIIYYLDPDSKESSEWLRLKECFSSRLSSLYYPFSRLLEKLSCIISSISCHLLCWLLNFLLLLLLLLYLYWYIIYL